MRSHLKLFRLKAAINTLFVVGILGIWVSGCAQSEKTPKTEKTKPSTENIISVGKGPDALYLTPDEQFLYVANVEDTRISVIDTRQEKVVQTIDGVGYPWGFTRLGESNEVAASGWDKIIAVIDFTRHEIVRQKQFDLNLGGIASTKDGKFLFVVATDANKVLKIDANSLEILDEYATGNGPDGIGISKDNTKIYVTNTKDGNISVIRLADKSSKTLATGGKPELVHYNHDHSLLFISNFTENKVHILNTETDEIIHEITGLDGPEEAVLSPDESHLFVVNFNAAKVFVYDAKTYTKLPNEYPTGGKPIGVMPVKNGNKLYVTNYADNSVSIIAR